MPTTRRPLLLALVGAAACSTTLGRRYDFNVGFMNEGPPWTEASHAETAVAVTREYVRPGDSLRDWRELLTVQVFDKARGAFPAPTIAEDSLRRRALARCPGGTWNTLASDSAGVLYEWRVSGCAAQADQHEIARIVEARDARARIAYARKGGAMPDSVRASWVERLRKARLTTKRR